MKTRLTKVLFIFLLCTEAVSSVVQASLDGATSGKIKKNLTLDQVNNNVAVEKKVKIVKNGASVNKNKINIDEKEDWAAEFSESFCYTSREIGSMDVQQIQALIKKDDKLRRMFRKVLDLYDKTSSVNGTNMRKKN